MGQAKILADADKMIPDTQKRLATAVEELRSILVSFRIQVVYVDSG